jgi:DNA polymerase-1
VSRETLYLIDGHAQIFRAYHAIRGGLNSPVTGEPTHAVFGFANMLLKLFDKFAPHYVAMAIDTAGPTFRDQIYDSYKATRDKAPDDFQQQEARIFQLTRLFGIPLLGLPGAEADDILATCVCRVLEDPGLNHVDIRLVSKDKDLEQLLGPRVTMFDIHTDTTIDVAWLKENKGITPQQVVDVLALIGDKVDNIPGVDGVGLVTAAKLVQEFGSIDGILANLDQIKGKRRENIEKAIPFLPTARKLVALKCDVEIPFRMSDARAGGIDAQGVRQFFQEMGFKRHISELDRIVEQRAQTPLLTPAITAPSSPRVDDAGFATSLFDMGPAAPVATSSSTSSSQPAAPVDDDLCTAADGDYRAITTREQLDELVASLRASKVISVDTETIGLGHRSAMCGLSFSWKARQGVYVPVASPDPSVHLDRDTVLSALGPVLEDPAIGKCGHNLKYDILVLRTAGIRVRGVVFDSMIGAFLLNLPGRGLDDLALALCRHRTIPISQLIGQRERGKEQRTMDCVPLDQITPYASEDADIALRLCELMTPMIEEQGLRRLCDEVEMPLIEVLAEMEHHGIRVDPDELLRQKQQMAQTIVDLRSRIQEAAEFPFNPDSPRQLAEVLFDRLKLPVIKRGKTGPSTDIEVLERLADMQGPDGHKSPVPKLIVEYRQLTKLVNTYLDALRESIHPDTRRVHASFHQTGAATGRLSSSDPNLQNIPIRTEIGRQIRKAFLADSGCRLISADYSQIELRILAHLSEDPALIEAFRQDLDIHTAVASQVFNVPAEQVTPQMRTHAKTINFGIIYGVTAFGLARRIDNLDKTAAQQLIDSYKRRFSGINTFLQDCVHQAERHGYVSTMLGRRREITQITSHVPNTRALAERLAINSVVQGSAADLIKLAMVNLQRRIEREQLPMKMLLQIHDELVLEAEADQAEAMAAVVCHEMEAAMTLRVPLKVEAGIADDWLNAK